ncbi:hypothetical protein FDA33_10030 [Clostridium botulinum]|uniref:Uncharacterized protein n=1 Tax=Clostridium botulinum TaxID=1491 RepID=A0A846JU75_CLOBO|nr:hypothetical protein [Clostridium botulinum]NFH90530.1 hypothetical protein [Clostridium botulinum]NFI17214.1 hypothetical protein [Clostridium botulinum]NFN06150.1 hypothetical protein [Clostridium botulinum]NFN19453.1 hypothetical protein [Clostridium botulinum]
MRMICTIDQLQAEAREDLRYRNVNKVSFLKANVYKVRKRMEKEKSGGLKIKEYVWKNNLRKKSLSSLSKHIYYCEEHCFLYKIFGIEQTKLKLELSFEGVNLPNDADSASFNDYINVRDLKLISSVEDYEIVIKPDSIDEYVNIAGDCNIKGDIVNIDHFAPGILFRGNFDYVSNIDPWTIIEYSERTLECNAYGLPIDNDYPMWVEYLLTSYVMYDIGNERLAFFSAFAALDQYIELLYGNLETTYYNLMQSRRIRNPEVFDKCCDKIEKYQNMNRRIIEDKFKDIMHECVINFEEYGYLYDKLYGYEEMRNKVAHCEEGFSDGNYLDLVFVIIEIIYLTGTGKELVDNIFEIYD